jgi:16S rRNA (adenine1518-N6/adenine1519-N6)-dimethyltransferase
MNINYDSAKELKAFLEEKGLGMRKKYGQNFLINPNVRKALLDALNPNEGDEVWEIGPGLGAMTAGLLQRGAQVTAFEIDPGFIRLLGEIFPDEKKLTLVEGDALKTWKSRPAAPFLLGNLPYNIGAALLAGFIENGRVFRRIVVTVQKETARRMAASPGETDYSSFSVVCRSRYKITPLMTIKGASFYPVPRVDSQGVILELRDEISGAYPESFYPLVRHLFSVRRKTIKNGLQSFLFSRIIKGDSGGSAASAHEILKELDIRENERAENLDIPVFERISGEIDRRSSGEK